MQSNQTELAAETQISQSGVTEVESQHQIDIEELCTSQQSMTAQTISSSSPLADERQSENGSSPDDNSKPLQQETLSHLDHVANSTAVDCDRQPSPPDCLCSNDAIAEFMLQQPARSDDKSQSLLNDDEQKTVTRVTECDRTTVAEVAELPDGEELENIVYEDIDQYQISEGVDNDEDSSSAAYLDPASSLSERIRLCRAELLPRRRQSAASSSVVKSSSLRSYRSTLLRSSMGSDGAAVTSRNGSCRPEARQQVPGYWTTEPPSRRTLTRGYLLLVTETGADSACQKNDFASFDGRKLMETIGTRTPAVVQPCDGGNSESVAAKMEENDDAVKSDRVLSMTDVDSKDDRLTLAEKSPEPQPATSGGYAELQLCESVGDENDGRSSSDTPPRSASEPHVLAFDREGAAYYIPRSELRRYGDPTGESWFYPIALTVHQASLFIGAERQEGCFLVYRPAGDSRWQNRRRQFSGSPVSDVADTVEYMLSVGTFGGQVLHYQVVAGGDGTADGCSLSIRGDQRRRSFLTIGELVDYFRRNRGRLATRLRRPLREARWPPMAIDRKSFEIRREDLQLSGESRSRDEDSGMVCIGNYSDGKQTMPVSCVQKLLDLIHGR